MEIHKQINDVMTICLAVKNFPIGAIVPTFQLIADERFDGLSAGMEWNKTEMNYYVW